MAAEVTAADAAVISAEEVASAAAGRTEENAEAELAGQEDGAEQPAETPDMVPGETEIPSWRKTDLSPHLTMAGEDRF